MRRPVFPNTVVMFAAARRRPRGVRGHPAGPGPEAEELVRSVCAGRIPDERAAIEASEDAGGPR